ncbi:hypothetical protein AUM89_12715 [Cronobacter sakazakii]|nr:hypothetical protein CSK29544_01348 [Cronobacter sakazakii]EGT4267321.1 hypothetical protein [Cronobacter sakazakii]EGT4285115.1 hypothetical protein [Cronobacter sakazakii]EGT4293429.1 hypothetical protein [Cronobacter sakazakii]EGT4304702.1 hypothetical protein [Cronobacter sakazakii]
MAVANDSTAGVLLLTFLWKEKESSGVEPDKPNVFHVIALAERPLDNVLPFPVRRRGYKPLHTQRADEVIIARCVPVSFKVKINF